jgi:hypothetical protein
MKSEFNASSICPFSFDHRICVQCNHYFNKKVCYWRIFGKNGKSIKYSVYEYDIMRENGQKEEDRKITNKKVKE